MKQKNKEEFNCVKSFPQCIQWNLGDIPSLGISNGDYLDELVYAIVEKLCTCCGDIDVSTLSLQCIYDKIRQGEQSVPNPTLLTVLQLLIDNDCMLADLIANLQDQINDINSDTNLVLNLKCLAELDSYGNPLPYDLKSVLQKLINEICDLKDQVADLYVIVGDLQNQINAIDVTPFELPVITTCISPLRRLDLSVGDVATSLCSIRSSIGTEAQISGAMANQCSNFNDQFGSIVGWIPFPVNLAQSYSNLELAFCNVLNRLIAIESTCCAPTCDKIKIGFTADFDTENEEVTLNFTFGAGNDIPSGFTDCGTTLRITDKNGLFVDFTSLNIAQNATVGPLNISGLASGLLSFNFKTKFCLSDNNDQVIVTCQDCVEKTVDYNSDDCCTVTNTGVSAITVIYSTQILS